MPVIVKGRAATPTVSGSIVDLLAPDWRTITLEDVAVGLARQPRFCGQTWRPLSIAEHSLTVKRLLERRRRPAYRLAGLLHDAHEYLIGDLVAPAASALAELVGPAFRPALADLKHRLDRAIARAVLEACVPPDALAIEGAEREAEWLAADMRAPAVRAADDEALALEWAALVAPARQCSDDVPEEAPRERVLAAEWLAEVRAAAAAFI
jgi:5'-deoxynucleotidase YfbR-like HD superfamily hydrolase